MELASRNARGEQLVVEHALLPQLFAHRRPHIPQRLARKLGRQIVCALLELRRRHAFAKVHNSVLDPIVVGLDDHEDLRAVKGDELDVSKRSVDLGNHREAKIVRGARELVRHVRQHVADGAGLPQSCFHVLGVCRCARIEEQINVSPVSPVGRDPARRGMWMVDIAEVLEAGQDVSHRRGRQSEAAVLGQP